MQAWRSHQMHQYGCALQDAFNKNNLVSLAFTCCHEFCWSRCEIGCRCSASLLSAFSALLLTLLFFGVAGAAEDYAMPGQRLRQHSRRFTARASRPTERAV